MRGSRRKFVAATAAMVVAMLVQAAVAAAVPPTVTTSPATRVTSQSATLNGRVNPRGLATIRFFQYGPTTAYGASTPAGGAGSGTAAVAATAGVAALAPNTVYHYRLVAQNASGTTVGADRTFRTDRQPLGLALVATPNPVRLGGPTTLSGTLSGTGNAGQSVQIQQSPFPFATGFANAGNPVVTDAQGRFSVALLSVFLNTRFRALLTARPAIVSPPLTVAVQAIVRTKVTRQHVRRGGRVRFFGTLRPAEPNRPLAIQKRRGTRWITVAGTIARSGGAGFSIYGKTIRVRRGGDYRIFVGAGNGATAPAVGRTVRIRTSR
jgi:hypothetical protein